MNRTRPTATPPAASRVHVTDVVVVGARVAGAATATHLARAGHDVMMLDRAGFPSDTISTHVIPRSGMVQLARLGVVGELVVVASARPTHREPGPLDGMHHHSHRPQPTTAVRAGVRQRTPYPRQRSGLGRAVTVLGDDPPRAGADALDARWVPLEEVAEWMLVDGLAEFLHEHGILRTIT